MAQEIIRKEYIELQYGYGDNEDNVSYIKIKSYNCEIFSTDLVLYLITELEEISELCFFVGERARFSCS